MASHRIGARLCRLSPEQLLAFIDEQAPLWSDAAIAKTCRIGARLWDLSPEQLLAFIDEQAPLWSYSAMHVAEEHAARVDPDPQSEVLSEVLLSPDLVTHILSKMPIQEHPVKRSCHTWYDAWGCTLKYRERPHVLVIGGHGRMMESVSSLQRYDPSTNEWEEEEVVAPMQTARLTGGEGDAGIITSPAMLDGKLYVVGGTDDNADDPEDTISLAERYDLATNAWEEVAPMTTPREDHATAVLGGKLYAVGGYDDDDDHAREHGALSSVERYDPVLNAWETVAPMATLRRSAGVAVLDGKLYAVGGRNGSGHGGRVYLNSVERYDPVLDAWEAVAPMATARMCHAVAVLDGKLYALGGNSGGGGSYIDSVERYDAAADVWEQVAPMTEPRCSLAIAVTYGKLYAMGGFNDIDAPPPPGLPARGLSSVECYDPVLDAWEALARLPIIAARGGRVRTYERWQRRKRRRLRPGRRRRRGRRRGRRR